MKLEMMAQDPRDRLLEVEALVMSRTKRSINIPNFVEIGKLFVIKVLRSTTRFYFRQNFQLSVPCYGTSRAIFRRDSENI